MTTFRLWAGATILCAVLFLSIGVATKAIAPRCIPYQLAAR